MKYGVLVPAAMLTGVCTVAPAASAQQPHASSRSSGFFVGLGVEGDGVSSHVAQSDIWTRAAGGGAGLLVGYGLTPRWSLYSDLSVASIDQNQYQGGRYSLRHIDAGVSVHFRTGPHAVVPFAQVGFSGRSMIQRFPQYTGNALTSVATVESRSAGVGFGGGLNAHFNPAFAFSGSVAWTIGNFNEYKQDGRRVDGVPWHATSGRLRVGIVWFPQSRG